MKNKLWFKRYMDKATDGTEGGAGGGAGSDGNPAGGNDDDKSAGGEGEGGEPKKPAISDETAKLVKENMQRKEKIQKLEAELTQAKETAKQFEGIDPVAVKALLAKQAEEETKALEAKGQWDTLKQQMVEAHSTEKSTLEQRIKDLQAQLDGATGNIQELTIGSQFSNSPFIKDKLLLPASKAKVVYGSHFDFVDGQVVGFDAPKGAAKRAPLVDGAGNPLSFDLAIQKLVEADPEKDSLLRATIKPGAGSDTEPVNKSIKTGDDNPSSVNKIAAGLKGLK
jgi:hypothetical protein